MALQNKSHIRGLILLSGESSLSTSELLFSALAPFAVHLNKVDQISSGGRTIIMVQISLDPAHAQAISQDLADLGVRTGLDIAIDFAETFHGHSTHIFPIELVMLSQEMHPRILAKILKEIIAVDGLVATFTNLGHEPISALEIKFSLTSREADLDRFRENIRSIALSENVDIRVARHLLERNSPLLVVLDMDSTLIQQEVIDLLAARANVATQVSDITARAMAGDIDFAASLRERVALLEGLPETALKDVINDISFTPGAGTLLKTIQSSGGSVGVVSGGFLEVIEPLLRNLGVNHYRANRLEMKDGKLTGKLVGEIVDRAAKAQALRDFADMEKIPLNRTVAIGDGANDLDMLSTASLGIAFNAKPALREAADTTVSIPNLAAALYLLGISQSEFSE